MYALAREEFLCITPLFSSLSKAKQFAFSCQNKKLPFGSYFICGQGDL